MRLGHEQSGLPGKHALERAARSVVAAWRDYFPNSEIFGADIDRDVLFDEDRIRTYYVDQLDPEAIASMWSSIGCCGFRSGRGRRAFIHWMAVDACSNTRSTRSARPDLRYRGRRDARYAPIQALFHGAGCRGRLHKLVASGKRPGRQFADRHPAVGRFLSPVGLRASKRCAAPETSGPRRRGDD
jgi:hypothetical protein